MPWPRTQRPTARRSAPPPQPTARAPTGAGSTARPSRAGAYGPDGGGDAAPFEMLYYHISGKSRYLRRVFRDRPGFRRKTIRIKENSAKFPIVAPAIQAE